MTERPPTAGTSRTAGLNAQASPAGPPPLPRAPANGAPPDAETVESPEQTERKEQLGSSKDVLLFLPSWLASMVVHLVLVLLLAMLTFAGKGDGGFDDPAVSVDYSAPTADVEELENQLMQSTGELDEVVQVEASQLTDAPKLETLAGAIGLVQPQTPLGTEPDPLGGIDSLESAANFLALRADGALRAQMLRESGGTAASEEAVGRALQWLAEHQNYEGSWTFQHDKSAKCRGACDNPGFAPGKIAATAMALLPFLGTGQTHVDGQYKRNIDLGLKFLVRSMEMRGEMGSLFEQGGQMYGHGLASIALCEAYGMTHDRLLRDPAQAAINFIVEAQDLHGGGWRYLPRQPGDTSVVGWQLMALKSAQMAYLRVPPDTMRRAGYFLDRVQSDRGATYGYQRPERGRPATTAIGLLCRMYLGWPHDHRPLARGVRILGTLGPSTDVSAMKNNMYYNYYATQVMHHWGGSDWKRWNEVMREYLIETQATAGHEAGSWFFAGADLGSPAGGRLYCTAMAAMTLEVYYRHMPLYRPQSTQSLPGQ